MLRKGSKTLREERKQSGNSLGGYVQAVWSGASPDPSHGWNRWSGEAERSIAPSGGTGSSGRWSRWGPGSAVVDEGELAVAWQESAVPWQLRAIDQMVYAATFGVSEGTWGTVSSVTL